MLVLQENINNLAEMFNISARENIPLIFPTDTIYGIGASISSILANQEIYKIKKRPIDKPFPILAGSFEQAELIADLTSLNNTNYKFMCENYNKHTTFIIKAKDSLLDIFKKDNKVAVRIPNKEILCKALLQHGFPVTATSVNESGQSFLNNISDIIKNFNKISLFVEGCTIQNISSSIYDISGENIVKIR